MPIRINLLAEAQALEEMRRKDPVKRAALAAGALVCLALVYSSYLQLRAGIARVLSGEPREPLFAVQSSNAPTDETQARQGVDAPVENELEQDVLK